MAATNNNYSISLTPSHVSNSTDFGLLSQESNATSNNNKIQSSVPHLSDDEQVSLLNNNSTNIMSSLQQQQQQHPSSASLNITLAQQQQLSQTHDGIFLTTQISESNTAKTNNGASKRIDETSNNSQMLNMGGGDHDDCNLFIFNKCINSNKKLNRFVALYIADIRCFCFFMCLIVMLTNALTVGYRNSVITTIEKRFEISSLFSGILSGILEVGSLIATLFVSYFFTKSHIPRSIAVAALCCSIGSFMYAWPHLMSASYTVHNQMINQTTDDLMCKNPSAGDHFLKELPLVSFLDRTSNRTAESKLFISLMDNNEESSLLSKATSLIDSLTKKRCFQKTTNLGFFLILIVANLLIGSSSAPLYTLATTYIDNHVSKDNTSIYLAFMYSMLAFGPVVGYLVGAGFLQIYVDLSYNSKDLKIEQGDSNWVGAWYGGFILFGVLIFFTAFPFFCFPREISKNRIKVEHDRSRYTIRRLSLVGEEESKVNEDSFGRFKTLPKAIWNILINRVFFVITLAYCCEITIISGFMTFLPKFMENQYGLNNSLANIYTGGIAIPGACVGIVLGGFLVKKFKIDPIGASKMAIICNSICLAGITVLIFLGCPNAKIAGITTSISNLDGFTNSSTFNLTQICNANCGCSKATIEPICGINGITYFSPCFAGCTRYEARNSTSLLEDTNSISRHNQILDKLEEQLQEKKFQYFSCNCIIDDLKSNMSLYRDYKSKPNAYSGYCPTNCTSLVPFMIILFFVTLLTAINQMPMLMVTLRSVSEIERPFALGLQLVIMRLLAYIPSPLIFGRSIDYTCLSWRQDSCDQIGACLLYDREKFRHIFGSIAAVYKGVSIALFALLYLSVKKFVFTPEETHIDTATYIKGSLTSLNRKQDEHLAP